MLYHAGRGERVVVPSFLLRDAVAVIEDHHSARAALAAAVVTLADGTHDLDDCSVCASHHDRIEQSYINGRMLLRWEEKHANTITAARLIAGEGT